jgi:hypothetical protein
MAKTKAKQIEEQPIPETMTFTAREWNTVMAGRAARMVAAGTMPSLAEFTAAMEAASIELRAKLRLARGE